MWVTMDVNKKKILWDNVFYDEIFIQGLCEKGRVLQACESLLDFFEKGVLPKGFDFSAFMEVLCGQGCAGRALEVVYELWNGGSVSSLVACIGQSCIKDGISKH